MNFIGFDDDYYDDDDDEVFTTDIAVSVQAAVYKFIYRLLQSFSRLFT